MINNNKEIYIKYSELSSEERVFYYDLICRYVGKFSWEYPGFFQWYSSLFLDNYQLMNDREIIVCEKDFSIVGLAILKSNAVEKKICTLRVDNRFRGQGIGKKLMGLSLEWLQYDTPIITMHKTKQHQFSKLLDFYGFKLEQKQPHYYRLFNIEYVYNGILPDKKIVLNQLKVANLQGLCKSFIDTGRDSFEAYLGDYIRTKFDNRTRFNII